MTQISNADKQARFRKKEALRRHADKVYRDWEMSISNFKASRTPEDVRHSIEKAAELPSGWTDDDLQHALKRLGQCQLDLQMSVDQIANDVHGDWSASSVEFMTTFDPAKYQADQKAAVVKAKALASHLISALRLSNCNDAEQAAAVMELPRFIGRSLATERKIHRSHATAMCLASIGPQYDRPDWFAEELAKTIGDQIGKELAQKVARHLSKL